jgi:hypothetical protein
MPFYIHMQLHAGHTTSQFVLPWGSPAGGDGNGYPLPETWWVFALLGYEFGLISIYMSLLMGSNGNPMGTWAWICSSTTHTRKPMGF